MARSWAWRSSARTPSWFLGVARMLSSTDGATWTEINAVAWSASLDFTSSTLGWAVALAGDESALVRSDDGGASWEVVEAVVGP